ncbi:antitoxin VapB family protein [Halalkalicoccus sp. NIPERK01]|uniref:antitoxin VapB family protein n=1 Tax=Halalkalicoccus sp. NIPERK01 TaxID=3053469 RepID=UPI00256F16E3|nr:antitoxin VapB family protein [Halalkalicoccus sp. NIPERK01]MDL5362102.1 antitoxin VapB family protein [Halalkalicoccus sp. NIPERK01]
MGTRTVRLREDVYERISAHKREDETFSEAIDRLVGGPSLLDLVGAFSDEQVEELREAVEESDERDREEVEEIASRFE